GRTEALHESLDASHGGDVHGAFADARVRPETSRRDGEEPEAQGAETALEILDRVTELPRVLAQELDDEHDVGVGVERAARAVEHLELGAFHVDLDEIHTPNAVHVEVVVERRGPDTNGATGFVSVIRPKGRGADIADRMEEEVTLTRGAGERQRL